MFCIFLQPVAARQVAALLLRKRAPGHYSKLPDEYKAKLKSDILQFLSSEPERAVRKGAIGVAVVICKQESPAQDEDMPDDYVPWPELFQLIAAATQETHADARELAFLLLMDFFSQLMLLYLM